ncbi:hypothetical protein XBLMG947_2531 [Xanthomonas bromi]|uniref:Uncharacterized protein n=1 Tax=Xanthomonas bromi TaxID=56449 RepID=A0A1C3NMZ7_9XANT|nr:hypothetical protein XBLMG947_2531 [Xanthomonas bromi]
MAVTAKAVRRRPVHRAPLLFVWCVNDRRHEVERTGRVNRTCAHVTTAHVPDKPRQRINAWLAFSTLWTPRARGRNPHWRNLRSNAIWECGGGALRARWSEHACEYADTPLPSTGEGGRRLEPANESCVIAGCFALSVWAFPLSGSDRAFRAMARSAAHGRQSSGTAPSHPRYRCARAGSCGNDRHWRGSGHRAV